LSGSASRIEVLHDTVVRIALRTPTLPPATTTNTLLVGASRLAIVEPATPYADERGALDEVLARLAADGRRPAVILLTHHHADHVGDVERLQQAWSIPVRAHPETATRLRLRIDAPIEDGEVIDLGEGVRIEATFTPGHAPGHLVYREASTDLAYAGDMVAGEGTILVDPEDGGDMAAYLQSLHRVEALGASRLVPSHGPVIEDPPALVRHYVRHRLAREAKVVAAIEATDGTLPDVLAHAYDDTPRVLWPLAERSLLAHVNKLVAEGRVTRTGDRLAVVR
jgi:ribonuclease/clavin/mitogillin